MQGGKLVGGTVSSGIDPSTYCAMANAGYDFIWTEMQHANSTWDEVGKAWRTCPHAKAVPGVRVPYADEFQIQHALDAGALVIVVPTVDTVEEAKAARDWTYFPPLGKRSLGGGFAFGPDMWGSVPGGYRNTINDNVVLILMIETLEGLKHADEIAKVPGVHALFAASSDLGNFSGYKQGDPDYERAINIVHDATLRAGVKLSRPVDAWRDRPDFSCFQAGNEMAAIARGVKAELGEYADTQGKPEVGPLAAARRGARRNPSERSLGATARAARRAFVRQAETCLHKAAARRNALLAPRAGARLMPCDLQDDRRRDRGSFTRFAASRRRQATGSRARSFRGHFRLLAPHPAARTPRVLRIR